MDCPCPRADQRVHSPLSSGARLGGRLVSLCGALVAAAAPAEAADEQHDERDDECDDDPEHQPEQEDLKRRRVERVDARVHVDCAVHEAHSTGTYWFNWYMRTRKSKVHVQYS